MAEEIKKEQPKVGASRWKIQHLGGDMMFIHDPNRQPTKEGRPFGWVMSEGEALKKFSTFERPKDEDELDLQNQVMSYIASRNNPEIVGAPKQKNKGGRPKGATGTAMSDAERAREYRKRKREAKLAAMKKGE